MVIHSIRFVHNAICAPTRCTPHSSAVWQGASYDLGCEPRFWEDALDSSAFRTCLNSRSQLRRSQYSDRPAAQIGYTTSLASFVPAMNIVSPPWNGSISVAPRHNISPGHTSAATTPPPGIPCWTGVTGIWATFYTDPPR
eukprot:gene9502-biopygen4863